MPTLSKTIDNIIKQRHMKEVKITIPDNCELIKDGDTYIVKEKKQTPPRSWKEFCREYPVKRNEYCIEKPGYTVSAEANLATRNCATWCTSREEAQAFLALMQLRQLRKAWVGDWKQPGNYATTGATGAILYSINEQKIIVDHGNFWVSKVLSFPTKEMAEDFLDCFRDLCETAKILL